MTFGELCDSYLKRCWRADPVGATRSGMRGYDHLFPDRTPEGLAADRAELERLLTHCAQQERESLTPEQQLDLDCMICDLEDGLLVHELAEWASNPQWYAAEVADGLNLLFEGDWAPAAGRAGDLIQRLNGSVALLALAKQNLEPAKVPPLWVEIAQQATRGAQAILDNHLPHFLAECGERAGEVSVAADQVAQALVAYNLFLEELGPKASGSYAVGAEIFTQILRRRHLLEMDAHQLYEWGLEQVARYEAELALAGAAIDPNRHWTEIMDEIRGDYPPADRWLEAFQENMATAKQHLIDHDLVSIPEGEYCRMVWTAEHRRATHPLGGVDFSPPYSNDLESHFFVTPNDETAPLERQEQHHRDLNWAFLRSIALHEVYPGHHLQAVHAKQGQSMVRRWQHSTTLIEGWGLYTETLMHETGYLSDPRVHLIYVKNSLWRAVRVVIDVGLHALGMSFDEAVQMLQTKLRMEHHMAAGEVRRYTMSPTYQSSYLLGRTAILALREAYQAKVGEGFTLKLFHDRLLSYGSAPMTLIRKAMLS